jgi:hypothetical protein
MLIGSRFKRPKAPIELPPNTYHFLPIDPANPDSEHVCEVTNEDHIQRLLSITEGYYISKAQALPTTSKPAPAAPPANPPAATASNTPPADDKSGNAATGDAATSNNGTDASDTVASGLPVDMEEAAKNLNGLSWQKLKAELGKGGIEVAVVKRALEIELAQPDVDQRVTTIKILKQHLGVE